MPKSATPCEGVGLPGFRRVPLAGVSGVSDFWHDVDLPDPYESRDGGINESATIAAHHGAHESTRWYATPCRIALKRPQRRLASTRLAFCGPSKTRRFQARRTRWVSGGLSRLSCTAYRSLAGSTFGWSQTKSIPACGGSWGRLARSPIWSTKPGHRMWPGVWPNPWSRPAPWQLEWLSLPRPRTTLVRRAPLWRSAVVPRANVTSIANKRQSPFDANVPRSQA